MNELQWALWSGDEALEAAATSLRKAVAVGYYAVEKEALGRGRTGLRESAEKKTDVVRLGQEVGRDRRRPLAMPPLADRQLLPRRRRLLVRAEQRLGCVPLRW